MNFTLFLEPVEENIIEEVRYKNTWFHHIEVYTDNIPKWKEADMVILGVPEQRGTSNNLGVKSAPNEVRKALYQLKRGQTKFHLADLGNIKPGPTLEDTLFRVKEICAYLLEHAVVPIIIGGSQDILLGQYWAFEGLESMLHLLNVDAYIDMEDEKTSSLNQHYLSKIFSHEPNYLWNYTHLAHQSYLVDSSTLSTLGKIWVDAKRVGEIKNKIETLEPILRDTHLLSFDVSAIRKSDSPACAHVTPFGLTSEEACQLAWYAGASDKLRSIGFYEYNPLLDDRGQTAMLIATMIWYFIEGYSHRLGDLDFTSTSFTKYVVTFERRSNTQMVFYKHNTSGKWWIMIDNESYIFPCSYEDYQMAMNGDMPNRWLSVVARLI